MTRLVQLKHPKEGRRVAVVQNEQLRLLQRVHSIFDLAMAALSRGGSLAEAISAGLSGESLEYAPIYEGNSIWKLLPAFDHPQEPARCLVTGTGLTHKASAQNRQAMHAQGGKENTVTDSMRMYQWGLKGGRPAPGKIGTAPEWFYKGCGTILRAHGEPLEVPAFGDDGGEEPEVAGVYVVDSSGKPWRVGLVAGNEFSDHQLEKKNYLYLAPSKLRCCSIGPELIVDAKFEHVKGAVRVERSGKVIWRKEIFTGEKNMSHTVANLEHHHFKYPAHCRAGDPHIHFFGADAFSFGEGVALKDGDIMEIEWNGFGRPLRNPIKINRSEQAIVRVEQL